MERAEVDCVVVGAGVIGLACARRVAQSGREVLILESESDIGSGISARKGGKLVVATTSEQIPALHKLMDQARANHVDDLALLGADQARALEPQLACVAAFHSPSTGIVDTHGLMLSLLGEAEARGAALARHAPVERGWLEEDGRVTFQVGGHDPMQVTARLLVNAAGLGAQGIAGKLQ